MADTTATKKVSKSESGHAKNVANLGVMISAVNSFGTAYNPAVVTLTLTSLKTLKTSLDALLAKVAAAEAPYKTAVNKRQEAFEGMSALSTRVLNALAVSGSDREIKDAKGMVKNIRGGGKLKAEDAGEAAKTRSTSRMSFDNRLSNFKALVALLGGIPAYKPNEADLKILSLNKYLDSLPALSTAVNNTADALSKARIERDKLLYAASTGAVALSLKVKKYVKSVYGATSPEYKRIAKIELKNK